ncbi:MAG: hypothetical protein A3F41_05395 [Coxiella sp. RIFCSPHIGHO2_12_FULL_44_14]|nr:MAG: hypothetical protein A3F41_05395 [Coxiella sp. RIFCSPHIGHO2_12_FULL_44_14]
MPNSKIKMEPPYTFSDTQWVISVMNPAKSIVEKIAGGHAVLLVEGLKENLSSPHTFNPPLFFVGQYDIRATALTSDDSSLAQLKNIRGYISEIRVIEKTAVTEEEVYTHPSGNGFYRSQSQSYLVLKTDAEEMIKAIKIEQKAVSEGRRILYQSYGSSGGPLQKLFSENAGINCAEWCMQKLAVAKIHLDVKPKPSRVAGGCYII